MEPKLPFGLRDGHLYHVSEVARGIDCACFCPGCGAAVVARKGNRVTHHFAHNATVPCAHGLQTALHMAAKELLARERHCRLPPVTFPFTSYKKPWTIVEERDVEFFDVSLETALHGIVPDVIGTVAEGDRILLEIVVTHDIDERKMRRVRQLGLPLIRVDLSDCERDLDREVLKLHVVESAAQKKWLYHPKVEDVAKQVEEAFDRRSLIHHGPMLQVDDCPLRLHWWDGRYYANGIGDCPYCEFCYDHSNQTDILCGGRYRVNTYEQFQRLDGSRVEQLNLPF